MDPKIALVRQPSSSMRKCISSHPHHKSFNLTKARTQHDLYCKTLETVDLEVIHLESRPNDPDSCFIEDNAIIHKKKALICRMGAEVRRSEVEGLQDVLKQYLDVKSVEIPGTIEGGDVIHFRDRLICGLSQRTNQEAVDQMSKWLEVRVTVVEDASIIHLKSHITSINENLLIGTRKFSHHPIFQKFKVLVVKEEEKYAANTLTIGNVVIMPIGSPEAQFLVEKEDYEVITLDMSEFQKCEGAITCLSLLI
ncbi:MAG: hypothetical protein EAX86_12180 [Candidatus Heimdallarchaeota archaeon]|nr:hypothetical protein [Candidatus Heimdallarchaeota archaeon]